MAVGAKARHILLQFLAEATVLSMTGGMIGVALGLIATSLIGKLAQWPTVLEPTSVAASFLFSGAVGIFFGYYRRTNAVGPIAALRWGDSPRTLHLPLKRARAP
jgi:putative ABC transport system permease protein